MCRSCLELSLRSLISCMRTVVLTVEYGEICIHIRKQDVKELFSDLWPLCSVGISMHVLECW